MGDDIKAKGCIIFHPTVKTYPLNNWKLLKHWNKFSPQGNRKDFLKSRKRGKKERNWTLGDNDVSMYIIPCSKCATVVGDVDVRRLQTCGKRGYMGRLSTQFCYELKTALKCSILPLNTCPLDFVVKMGITSYWTPVGPASWTHGARRFLSSSVAIKCERKSISFPIF